MSPGTLLILGLGFMERYNCHQLDRDQTGFLGSNYIQNAANVSSNGSKHLKTKKLILYVPTMQII